uniref:Uncharacterized protein n=1 Tax=Anguilla anguilla TaxID=7936 RepID=A0A0E9WZ70_ANGAN
MQGAQASDTIWFFQGLARTTGFTSQQFIQHGASVAKAAGQLLAAAVLLDHAHFVGAELPLLVNVRHRSHKRAQDQFCVILEEVDLHCAIAEVKHDGALGAEPVTKVGQARQLIAVPRGDVGSSLQQVLTHVVTEVFEQSDLLGEHGRVGAHTHIGLYSVLVNILQAVPVSYIMSLVESLKRTPTLLSHSWYPRPYLSE